MPKKFNKTKLEFRIAYSFYREMRSLKSTYFVLNGHPTAKQSLKDRIEGIREHLNKYFRPEIVEACEKVWAVKNNWGTVEGRDMYDGFRWIGKHVDEHRELARLRSKFYIVYSNITGIPF